MTTLHETEVDGVRCFWVETGRPTLAARLVFRYGMADEPMTESGWQHLIEHVALDQFPRGGSVDVNGHVSVLDTAFDFHGDPAAVTAHLAALADWLRAPSFTRIGHEAGVLRAEADVRGGNVLARSLGWRYGARGPGLVTYAEPGLGRATADVLTDRVGRVFTSGNAALILDGPPPLGLALRLPDGPLRPPQPAVAVEPAPGSYHDAGIIVSGTVSRSSDMWVGVEVLQRVLLERLRHDEGGAYAPWTHYERVDATTAVVTAGSDIRPELVDSIVPTMRALLDDLASSGPREDWIADTVERVVRTMEDPYAAIGVAARSAMRHLQGDVPQSLDEMVEQVRSVSAATLAAGFAEMQQTLLVGATPDARADRWLRPLSFPSTSPTAVGGGHRSINWPADTSKLLVHAHGMEICDEGKALEAQYDDVVGLLVYDHGVRTAVRGDGYTLTLDPRLWTNGNRAVAELDRRIPVELHLPHPAPAHDEPPSRLSFAQRWWPATRRAFTSSRALLVALMAAYVLVGFGVVGALILSDREGLALPVMIGLVVLAQVLIADAREEARHR